VKTKLGTSADSYATWALAIWKAFDCYDKWEYDNHGMYDKLHEASRTLRVLLNEASTSWMTDDWERYEHGKTNWLFRFQDNSILRYVPTAERASVDEGDKWRASMWVMRRETVIDPHTKSLAVARDAARVTTLNALHAATDAKDRDMKTTLQTALTSSQKLELKENKMEQLDTNTTIQAQDELTTRIRVLRGRGFDWMSIANAIGVNHKTPQRWALGLGIYDATIEKCGGYPLIFWRLDQLSKKQSKKEKHAKIRFAIRKLQRRRRRLSAIAKDIGVTTQNMQNWMKGEYGPRQPHKVMKKLDKLTQQV